jgi:hypothetical protein
MGKHSTAVVPRWHRFAAEAPRGVSTSRPRSVPRQGPNRARFAAFLASCAVAALVLVVVVDPYSGAYANATPPAQWEVNQDTQTFVVADGVNVATRTNLEWTIVEPPPPPVVVAPATGTPDPGSAKAIALDMVTARGWDAAQYDCLVSLWNKESGWNQYAENKSSGAYGIPQAYPGSKMASAGADWKTNAATQITWGIGYIAARYSTPCGAWMNSQAKGSY